MTRANIRQRGFALLIVLWTLGLLALLGTQVLATGRQETEVARNMRTAAVLEAAASGAVQQAIFGVLDGSSGHWNADGVTRTLRIGAAVVAVRVDNEADKVNPSVASPALLQALLQQIGANAVTASAVAASIVEWRLGSGTAERRNATFQRYQAAGSKYAPSGEPITNIDELGSVMGMTPDLLARLRPHLTVFTDGDPGSDTRDPVVARALVAAGEFNMDASEIGEDVVSITADARGLDHGRFTLHVVVRTNDQPEGRRYEILARERVW